MEGKKKEGNGVIQGKVLLNDANEEAGVPGILC